MKWPLREKKKECYSAIFLLVDQEISKSTFNLAAHCIHISEGMHEINSTTYQRKSMRFYAEFLCASTDLCPHSKPNYSCQIFKMSTDILNAEEDIEEHARTHMW